MIAMKHRIVILCSAILFLALGAVAQEPTMVFDGSKLSVTVPTGRLEFQRNDIGNAAIRDCFEWGGRESCMFMAQNEPYVFKPVGLSTDEQVSVPGVFNGEPITIKVEMRPAPKPKTPTEPAKKDSNMLLYVILGVVLLALMAVMEHIGYRRMLGSKKE